MKIQTLILASLLLACTYSFSQSKPKIVKLQINKDWNSRLQGKTIVIENSFVDNEVTRYSNEGLYTFKKLYNLETGESKFYFIFNVIDSARNIGFNEAMKVNLLVGPDMKQTKEEVEIDKVDESWSKLYRELPHRKEYRHGFSIVIDSSQSNFLRKLYGITGIRVITSTDERTYPIVGRFYQIISAFSGIYQFNIDEWIKSNSSSIAQAYLTSTGSEIDRSWINSPLYCYESDFVGGKLVNQGPIFLQKDRIGTSMGLSMGKYIIRLEKRLNLKTKEEYISFSQSSSDEYGCGFKDNMKIIIWFKDSYGTVGGIDIHKACEMPYNQKIENTISVGITSTELDWLAVYGVKQLDIVFPDGTKKEFQYPIQTDYVNAFKNSAKQLAEFDLVKVYTENKAEIDKMNQELK